ncbi:MAG: ATP-binding protein, partial [Deferrisomatales bacterium]
VWSGRLTNRRKDGAWYEEECTVSPVRDEAGQVVNYVAVKRDVTREVRLEQQLAQSQRLEALGTLAGGIAHDFNNVLTPIIGYAELALEDSEPGTRIHRALGQVAKGAERAREIVRQILAFSRATSDGRRPVRLPLLVAETLHLLRAILPRTVELRQTGHAAPDTVFADSTQLQQVLMNLCTNAWHAIGEGAGVIEVNLGEACLPQARREAPPRLPDGPYLVLTVRDNGSGIAPEVLPRIFEPFFTTKEVGQGTGLGLSAVHGIAISHGGGVTVESGPGQGTAFRVWLPRAEGPADDEPAPEAAPRGGTERILFLDDEPDIVLMAEEALRDLGYRVSTAAGPAEVLAAVRADPGGYDLVITDQTMPGTTGLALAAELRGVRPDLPVLLLTGYSSLATPERLKAAGVAEVLGKPVSLGDLARAVRRVLDGAGAELR